MKKPGVRAQLATFSRSFMIQGSWNYRTMLGGGFAFSMLPALKVLYREDPDGFGRALQRHSEHFNAHPYLANLALGAAMRMEAEGKDPEEIRRFKLAVKGPLGSLGDALVWVGWRPAVVLASLVLALSGASPGASVVFFLSLYNLGHLLMRIWGFRLGWERGSQVGDSLRALALPRQAQRLSGVAALLLGGTVGLALSWARAFGPWVLVGGALAMGGLWLGGRLGTGFWKWNLWAMMGLIGLVFLIGWVA